MIFLTAKRPTADQYPSDKGDHGKLKVDCQQGLSCNN